MRPALIVAAMISLNTAPGLAANLVFDATGGEIRCTGDNFSGTAKQIAFDDEKGILTLSGDGKSDATFTQGRNGAKPTTSARSITYFIKTQRIKLQGFVRDENLDGGSTAPAARSSRPLWNE
jgi:hypothetical protein